VAVGESSPVALEVSGLAEALALLATTPVQGAVQCVVAGAGAVTAGGWVATGEELRRVCPNAALIALTGASPVGTAVGAAWDDVVRPQERDPALIARVLRSGFAIARALDRLARWAMRDPLTDLLNRRGLERVLVRENSSRERGGGPLVALLVDCDDFKRVNDAWGLATGDDVLRKVAEVLTGCVRAKDTVARVGGDEFLVLLPHTRTFEAVEVAQRIRLEARERVRLPDESSLTLSIGVRRLDERVTRLRDVVEATQDGLRSSKRRGKDQVRLVDGVGAEAHVAEIGARSSRPERPLVHDEVWVRDLGTGAPRSRILVPALSPEEALVEATHRATHAALDLAWFERALAGVRGEEPALVRLFPATLAERPTAAVLAAIPPAVRPEQVVVAVDDQYLTGDPTQLAARLQPLRDHGLGVCLELSDLGRSCLEALILVRPDLVTLDPQLTREIAGVRFRRTTIHRFAQVGRSLGIGLVALGVDSDADRGALLECAIQWGVGTAVPEWTPSGQRG
jgi:diguanylate cyclase (GGDEF)-like protein